MNGGKLIVVEGCDGTGKSTLVRHLAEKFGLEIGKRGVANRDFLYKVTRQDTYRALSDAVRGDKPPQIWDRLWISEYVYHGIHPGRPCEFSEPETIFIKEAMNTLGCPFILCLPPFEVVEQNVRAAHQMEGVKGAVREIYEEYLVGNLPWPNQVMTYDYTHHDPEYYATLDEVEEEIAGYIQERKARQAWDMQLTGTS